MEYISSEEFLKQDKEVQEVFWDWWTPRKGNINYSPVRNGIEVVEIENNATQRRNNGYIPLLTEGQIRKFIEDKTGCKIEVFFNIYKQYSFMFVKEKGEDYYTKETREFDLLQAYWKVAVQIANSEVK